MWGWRALLAASLAALVTFAGAARASWHGPWRGQDLYVTVITRGHPLAHPGGAWWQWGNTTTDAYLFGFGRPGVDLILDFNSRRGPPEVTISVVDRARRQNVIVRPDGYVAPPSTPVSVTMQPQRGSWLVNDRPNFKLQGSLVDVVSYGETTRPIKYAFQVGGPVPGEPAWITARADESLDPDVAYPRFTAALRGDASVPYRLALPLLPSFPFLSASTNYDFYGPNQPILFETGRRELRTHFVGFQTAGIYAMNSYASPPQVAFEAPFAWYRFDPQIGLRPNLIVRVEEFPQGYTFANVPQVQRTSARLSWTGADFRTWRYSLSVAGNHPLHERVLLGQQPVDSVPYSRLPGWLTTQPWRAVSFVEATRGLGGSEGIYAYSVEANPDLFPWINGLAAVPPPTFTTPYLGGLSIVSPHQLPEGYRGEYNLAYNRSPRLYVSPVDQRVHLERAAGGIWNLGGGYLLRMHNVNSGQRINAWLLERLPATERASTTPRATKSAPLQSLFALGGYLLYSDGQGAVIRQATLPPEVAVPTPINATRWRAFLARTPPQATRDPRNLRSWLRAFHGPGVAVPGGELRALRITPKGFRFVLTLPRASSWTVAALPGLQDLKAGQYVLSYDGAARRWAAVRATPPTIHGVAQAVEARAFTPGKLTVTLRNGGTLDQSGPATLLVNGTVVKAWENLTVPGRGAVTQRLIWSPGQAGTAHFTLRWRSAVTAPRRHPGGAAAAGDRRILAVPLGTVSVPDTGRVEGPTALTLSLPLGPALGTALLLGLLALGGYSLWRAWEPLA